MELFNKEQIYIVTGASSGLGQGIATSLCNEGATVVGIGRNEHRLIETKNLCKKSENFFYEVKDLVEDIENLPQYVTNLKNKYGKFQGLVCCAGITAIEPFMMMQYKTMQDIFNINYFAPLMLMKGVLDKRNILKENVTILAIASIVTYLLEKGMSQYVASKSALTNACRTIAKEYANRGIRINTISPADVETPMTKNLDDIRENRSDIYPLGQPTINDISEMALYLLSDKSKHITGTDFVVNGGLVV